MEKLTTFIISRTSDIEDGLEYARDAIRVNNNELAELFINVLKADFELLKVLISAGYDIKAVRKEKTEDDEILNTDEKNGLQN